MEYRKVIQGIIVGSFFTGMTLSIIAYVIVFVDNSVGDFGIKPGDFWGLAMILGFVSGFIFGGLTGAATGAFHFNLIKGALFGLLFHLFAVLLFVIWSGGGWDNVTRNFSLAFIVIGIVNGLLVSFVTSAKLNTATQ